jgi:Epoxide hydrolase N terminus
MSPWRPPSSWPAISRSWASDLLEQVAGDRGLGPGCQQVAQGRRGQAQAEPVSGLAAAHNAADRFTILVSLYDLALARQAGGDLDGAADLLSQGLSLAAEAGDEPSLVYYLEALAGVSARQDDPERAATLLAEAGALLEAKGSGWLHAYVPRVPHNDSVLVGLRARMTGAAFEQSWAHGRSLDIADLRRRITATRRPSRELVADRSQGVQLATIQELSRYWATEYDWRSCETGLNALPQFTTGIDGVSVHFIHVKSPHENALPLIMTHGWPGSVIELLGVVGPLTDPAAHGASAQDAFHLVLPSLPGYGFSGEPAEIGWNVGRIAQAWAELMRRLGYTRYVAQRGDVGASVTDTMGRQGPEGLAGIHMNLLVTALGGGPMPAGTEQERAALEQTKTFRASGFGYFLEQATRPQTIGYALLDSPAALAAWMLDHDTDAYEKITRAFVDGQPSGGLTWDHILDNITMYWLTGTGASAARSYWENGRAQALAAGQPPPPVKRPVGFTTFPGEIFRAPRSWVEVSYPTLTYFNQAGRGGHFAAWEERDVFTTEVRAAFKPLR